MKYLTCQEFLDAPTKVQLLYVRAMMGEPVGSDMAEDALKKYPEYFPDEIERRRKWDSIPQSVHDAYYEEAALLRIESYKDLKPSKGIIWMIQNPEEYKKWSEQYNKCREIEKPLEEELHKKHYEKYGI